MHFEINSRSCFVVPFRNLQAVKVLFDDAAIQAVTISLNTIHSAGGGFSGPISDFQITLRTTDISQLLQSANNNSLKSAENTEITDL